MGLNLGIDNKYYSVDVPAGRVLAQSPLPGAIVRREWRMRVTESLGPQRVAIPKVVGQQERVAAIEVRRRGAGAGRDRTDALQRCSAGHRHCAESAAGGSRRGAPQCEPAGEYPGANAGSGAGYAAIDWHAAGDGDGVGCARRVEGRAGAKQLLGRARLRPPRTREWLQRIRRIPQARC